MTIKQQITQRSRTKRRRAVLVEVLEARTLLAAATGTLIGPPRASLIQPAVRSLSSPAAVVNQSLAALQSALDSGPLADLNSGAVDGNGFVRESQNVVLGYVHSVNQQFLHSPRFAEVLDLQAQRVTADLISLNQQNTVGLISSSELASRAQVAINSLTTMHPLQAAPVSTYTALTKAFESDLNVVAESLSPTASPTLTPVQASLTVEAEAEAYRSDIYATLLMTRPNTANSVGSAVNTLEKTAIAIATDTRSAAQSQLLSAITTFNNAILNSKGVFGPRPVASGALPARLYPTANQVATTLRNVLGFGTVGGIATLSATLTLSISNQDGVFGEMVAFTIDGAFVGLGSTDIQGNAPLTSVPMSASGGIDSGGVVASFAGDAHNGPSIASGDLSVKPAATAFVTVAGGASFGGTATLAAALFSFTTGLGAAGQTVSFTLDGTPVGSAVTDSSGIATLAGVPTSQPVGTDTGGVVASFAGSPSFLPAANGTGNLTVVPAATTVSAVSGTAPFGGPATLTATLTSNATNQGLSGLSVNFALDDRFVGTAVTNGSGVATLAGVPTSDPVGTHPRGVQAAFAGTGNYNPSNVGVGDFVVT